MAAVRPALLRRPAERALLAASLALALWAVIVFWPPLERWWAIDVWWPEQSGETAREGMGTMVLLLALIAAAAVGLRRRA